MLLLEFSGQGLEPLIFAIFLLWAIPIVLIIVGLVRMKAKPKSAKVLIIIGGIWLVIAAGACGILMA